MVVVGSCTLKAEGGGHDQRIMPNAHLYPTSDPNRYLPRSAKSVSLRKLELVKHMDELQKKRGRLFVTWTCLLREKILNQTVMSRNEPSHSSIYWGLPLQL